MNKDFPRILTLLRKEKGLTQKQAATDLGVAQALLSHYEKGKRECGLDFLVKVADYYNVSTDYLLGRSPVSNGNIISQSDIPESDSDSKAESKNGNLFLVLNKKLIVNSIDIIFSLLRKVNSAKLTRSVASLLTLAVYKAFRITYNANAVNNDDMFTIPKQCALPLTDSAICIEEGAALTASKEDALSTPVITTRTIEDEYGKQGAALLNLVKNAEKRISSISSCYTE